MTLRPDDVFRPVSKWRIFAGALLKGVLLALLVAGGWLWYQESVKPKPIAAATVLAERRKFTHSLRRAGVIWPLSEERIFTKLAGTILEIALEGSLAQKDDIVLKLEANE